MKRSLALGAACLSLAFCGQVRVAMAAEAFNDTACPAANEPSRKLNAAFAGGNAVLSDDLIKTAEDISAAYKACIDQFDHQQNAVGPHEKELATDEALVDRLYCRLQYARAQQRVGNFLSAGKHGAEARDAYDDGLKELDAAAAIVKGQMVTDGAEKHVLDEIAQLRPALAADVKNASSDAPPANAPAVPGAPSPSPKT